MILFYILLVLICCPPLFLFLIWPRRSTKEMRAPFQGRNFAHRGLHTEDKSVPENSLAAFRAAADAGYGIELDIQFSKDEQVVVFHDNTLKRVCGIDGRVDAYTYTELQEFSLCQTGEKIPLFTDVLAAVNGRVPLIVELKNGPKNTRLCERAYEILRSYQGDFCVESFSPFIVRWFKKNAPAVLRGQLSAPAREFRGELPKAVAYILANCLTNVLARPHFIAYDKTAHPFPVCAAELLGAMRVVWTVRPNDPIDKIASYNDALIFEFCRPPMKNR
ncbi:MAG: glycerophosphodiester phosphodiesterase [Lachnospiraceae bacterium]|nr:glycerophosphodiester phosphodiesterase [Lachnospiraceae bacterium]